VLLFLAAANRDPAAGARDQFDVRRRATGHMTFGTAFMAVSGRRWRGSKARPVFGALAKRVASLK